MFVKRVRFSTGYPFRSDLGDGIEGVANGIVTEINKVVPVVSSVGVALLSVYVLVKAFRLVSGFVAGR
ncbi:major capsid protein [Neisseria meningitidis]|uniref:major capsid protein n=1 Tax=Neisseria meningitidis TaxID=487 RepID=UPI001E422B62